MLVQKLRVDDLQSEKGDFDGVMVYAQNKVGGGKEHNPGYKTSRPTCAVYVSLI